MTIVSPVCPAYSHEKMADGIACYTYDDVGTNIGIAGDCLVRLAAPLRELLCANLSIKSYHHHALVCDFDSYSVDIQRRLRISENEFAARVLQTIDHYRQTTAGAFSTCALSDLCGGKDGWIRELKKVKSYAARGNVAKLADRELIRIIGAEQRPRYERLFGAEAASASFCDIMTVYRVMDFATVGKIIAEKFDDPLVLGVGDGRLAEFFALSVDIPVLDLALVARSQAQGTAPNCGGSPSV